MEAIKSKLLEIVDNIQKKHVETMTKLAKEGKNIALERMFRREVETLYGVKVFAFTDRERGNLSHLVADLGTEEVGAFIIDAVANWKDFLTQDYLKHLPPTPVFMDLFWNRNKIQACIVSLKKKELKRKEPLANLTSEVESKAEEPVRKSNLMDMVKKAQADIRQKKEAI